MSIQPVVWFELVSVNIHLVFFVGLYFFYYKNWFSFFLGIFQCRKKKTASSKHIVENARSFKTLIKNCLIAYMSVSVRGVWCVDFVSGFFFRSHSTQHPKKRFGTALLCLLHILFGVYSVDSLYFFFQFIFITISS